jgi:hypothetical protein
MFPIPSPIAGAGRQNIPPNAVLVAGAGTAAANGVYTVTGEEFDRITYGFDGNAIRWDSGTWYIDSADPAALYSVVSDAINPWDAGEWAAVTGAEPPPTVTSARV